MSPKKSHIRNLNWLILWGLCLLFATSSCVVDKAPAPLGATPTGPGARIRYDLAHRPLPAIPMPNDTATWPDPSSRTGLRINASLVAPTAIETEARERFNQLEGWGTFAPLSLSFDVDPTDPDYADASGPAIDLSNVRARHQGDDFDFANDAVYLINLKTGIPVPLDIGSGNFDYTLKRLDKYWANDTRYSERNLMFETIDETQGGTIQSYQAQHDSDFDGVLDKPNFEVLGSCPDPDPVCDDPRSGSAYESAACFAKRRERDRCVADNLLDWYERESDTLLLRPLLPLDEMTPYAVVVTNRLLDRRGNAVKSPFRTIYHATQRNAAQQVNDIINRSDLGTYFDDLAGTGLNNVAFLWQFTTQPTVSDMVLLRDGLYGQGPFARWATQFPPTLQLERAVGLSDGLASGASDTDNWQSSPLGKAAGCEQKASNLFRIDYEQFAPTFEQLLQQGFGLNEGPGTALLQRKFSNISHMLVATFETPFLLEGGPESTDPNASFNINYKTGEASESRDKVQVWMIVPKATAKHQQPFDVNIYGHGYTGNFLEMVFYAGNMAEHGIATVGINAMGHGLSIDDSALQTAAKAALGGACYKPFYDAITLSRARDLNRDGNLDSGGDFWSSYLFHTRDGVRQSVLDHIQLVRIMRDFGRSGGMNCRNDGDKQQPLRPCDLDGDGQLEVAGDFDGDGTPDLGGPDAKYGTWGESLGGILSAIHGAVDAYVTSAVPGSGGGGLTDIGIRSFQGGVVEAVMLRAWGPLLVTVPATERKPCAPDSREKDRCTVCKQDALSLRWVVPDVNGTGEVEIDCLEPSLIADTTVLVRNLDNSEVRCASVDEAQRVRIGVPSSRGDRIVVSFFAQPHQVESYDTCTLLPAAQLQHSVAAWGRGRINEGAVNGTETATCEFASCAQFQGLFFGEGQPLVAPAEGFGQRRQSPSFRRFITLAQAIVEPGDPVSFAPYYALKPMSDPYGQPIAPHALLTLNTIGDMNVPVNSGIAAARASGALPFLRPEQATLYPHYIDYVTPQSLFDALGGRTPNQDLISKHVVEGISALSRYPADSACASSQNAAAPDATWLDSAGTSQACFPSGCTEESEANSDTRICHRNSRCDYTQSRCVPNSLGSLRCEEALWDTDDLDEGRQLYFEQASAIPHRLARMTASAKTMDIEKVWAPRLRGTPYTADSQGYQPQAAPQGRLTALLNAYIVPEGAHTFVNGEPCQAWDHGTYLTNLVARFFQSDGTDLYYLSHPSGHHCLATSEASCPYQQ